MNQQVILELTNEALMLSIYASAPPLILAMIVGLIVSILQALTQVQEPTTTFVAKALAIWIILAIMGTHLATTVSTFAQSCFNNFPNIVQ